MDPQNQNQPTKQQYAQPQPVQSTPPQQTSEPTATSLPPRTNKLSIAALITSVISLLLFAWSRLSYSNKGLILIGVLLISFVGFILSLISKSQIKKHGDKGRGISTIALIISIISFILGIIVFVYLIYVTAVLRQAVTNSGLQQNSSTSKSSGTIPVNETPEQKQAHSQAYNFMSAISGGEYDKAYDYLGPNLKKQYKKKTDFTDILEKENVSRINQFSITSVSNDSQIVDDKQQEVITVSGTHQYKDETTTRYFKVEFILDGSGEVELRGWALALAPFN